MPNKRKRKAAAIAEADPASDAIDTPLAKRGRPSKASKEVAIAEAKNVTTPPGKRGRPPKNNDAQPEETENVIPTSSLAKTNNNAPAKASAKNKATANTSLRRSTRGPANADKSATNATVVAVKETKPKGKANKAKAASPVKASTAKKGTRGFAKKPAKTRGKAAATAVADAENEDEDDSMSDENLAPEPVEEKPTKRGGRKPAKARGKAAATVIADEEGDDEDNSLSDENLAPEPIKAKPTKRGGREHILSMFKLVKRKSL